MRSVVRRIPFDSRHQARTSKGSPIPKRSLVSTTLLKLVLTQVQLKGMF